MRMHWLLLAVAFVTCGVPAHATLYDFALVGGGSASTEFVLTLPADPTPDLVANNGSFFEIDNVNYIQGGAGNCPCVGTFTFYTTTHGQDGGIETPDGYFEGPQLFSGSAAAPMFKLGEYDITYVNPDSFYSGSKGTVSIAVSAANPVPEPATWAMILAGMGMAGLAMRRRAAASVLHA